ncbi:MAG: hypothetical protein QOF61_3341 [Acidobacteriota bacterium]|nr:hypothetical protein [Acidobacteriota bacterium]
MMNSFPEETPRGWLAFELSVLRRLRFRSVANPLAGEPDLDVYLKRWGARVAVNDAAQWAWVRGLARVENNDARLSEADFDLLLEDVYVPHHRLRNPALARWFGETDAWWFDNYRHNAERLEGETRQAHALDLGMMVGDYALSFDSETRELRQPLSRALRRIHESTPAPVNNNQLNVSRNTDARHFVADQHGELLFLRLPAPAAARTRRDSLAAWREEWVRNGSDFWSELDAAQTGRLGARVQTKQQYLRFVEDLLEPAGHFKFWAISLAESGYYSTQEMVDLLRRLRKVDTIYTKDFSELTGARAAIITASS